MILDLPETQNETLRLLDVSVIAYFAAVTCLSLTSFYWPIWYQIILYISSVSLFVLFAVGIIACFKAKAVLKAEGKWIKLSLKEMFDFHWWRKGA